jgi:hypothetical protein
MELPPSLARSSFRGKGNAALPFGGRPDEPKEILISETRRQNDNGDRMIAG